MNAPARTVHLLDRAPGKPLETREVSGIKIEKGIVLPPRIIGKIDAALSAMEVGESFEHHTRIGTRRVMNGKKFTVRHQPSGKFRIWRIS